VSGLADPANDVGNQESDADVIDLELGGIPPQTCNHSTPERSSLTSQMRADEILRRMRETIRCQNVFLLNDFYKIHESGMRYMEYS